MPSKPPLVYVVDDEASVREALSELLESHGLRAMSFSSAGEYLAADRPGDGPACLILDIELPDINGLELQSVLVDGDHPPIVFITGHGDIPSSVRAIQRGAVDFLPKPFSDVDLLKAIQTALEADDRRRAERAERADLDARFGALTPRERDVLGLVVSGLMNKQAASQLGIREVTLEVHRRHVMQKMGAASLADLVRMAERLRIPITHSRRGRAEMRREPPRIAVVDDDARVLESLENLLESAGYAVRLYPSGGALFSAGISDIDALVTDIGMPGMNGFELHDAVKRVRPDLPVFLITGRHDPGDERRANACGVAAFFQKPFDGPALLACLADALRS